MPVGVSKKRAVDPFLYTKSACVIAEAVGFATPTFQFVTSSSVVAEATGIAQNSLASSSESAVISEATVSPVWSNQQISESSVIAECITNNYFSSQSLEIYEEGALVYSGVKSINFTGTEVTASLGTTQDIDINVLSAGASGSPLIPVDLTMEYTASKSQLLRCDTSVLGSFIIHLPASAAENDTIGIIDVGGMWGETGYHVTIDAEDGKLIDGQVSWDLDKSHSYVEVHFNATTDQWDFHIIPGVSVSSINSTQAYYETVSEAELHGGENQLCYVEENKTFYQYIDHIRRDRDGQYYLATQYGGETRWVGVAGFYVAYEIVYDEDGKIVHHNDEIVRSLIKG